VKRPPIDDVPSILAENPDIVCVAPGERYLVLYAISYDHDDAPSPTGDDVRSPREAAHRALELTRDVGSADTPWLVYDAVTEKWSSFSQSEIETP